MNSYNNNWANQMKQFDKNIARDQQNISNLGNLTNTLDAHKDYYVNNDPFLFKTMASINKVVDKNLHGVIEQGVYIGGPVPVSGGARNKPSFNPMVGTDMGTYTPSNNAPEALVDAISSGGAKRAPKVDLDLKRARASLQKYLDGEQSKRPIKKHLELLHQNGELEGGNIFKSIGKTVSKGAKSVAKTTEKGAKAVAKTTKKIAKPAASLGLDILERAAPTLGGLAGTALAIGTLNPELAPVGAALGSAAADQLAKRGRSEIKRQTGVGKPKQVVNKWVDHVKAVASKNGITYKEALSKAKASYKK